MSWWESMAFGVFESWLTQAVKNPDGSKASKLRPRLTALRDLLNRALKTWGWEE
jgi:hypothetical protein